MAPAKAEPLSWVYVKLERPRDKAATVLSVDGGGTRGMIPAAVLVHVEAAIKHYIKEYIKEKWEAGGAERLTVATMTVRGSGREEKLEEPVAWEEANFRTKLNKEGDGSATLATLKRDFMHDCTTDDFSIRLADYFDLFAGTSTGSIITTYLAAGGMQSLPLLRTVATAKQPVPFPGSAAALVAMFRAQAKVIFPPMLLGQVHQLFGAKYSSAPLKGVLKNALGDATLADGILPGTMLLITSYELARSRPITFFSLPPAAPAAGPEGAAGAASEPPPRRAGVAAPAFVANKDDWLNERLESPVEDLVASGKVATGCPCPCPCPCTGIGGAVYRGGGENGEASTGTPRLTVGGAVINRSTAWGISSTSAPTPGSEGSEQPVLRSEFRYRKCDVALQDVVLASTAAPTYLPAATVHVEPVAGDAAKPPVPREILCVDGGVAANNPAPEALLLLKAAGNIVDRVAILSLGTGVARKATSVPPKAGIFTWLTAGNLFDMVATANSTISTAQLEYMSDKSGWPYVLRLNKTVWEEADDACHASRALESMDLSSAADMKLFEEMGSDLVEKDNNGMLMGLAVGVAGERKDKEILNKKLVKDFVVHRIFKDFSAAPKARKLPPATS